jgi:hypothetical protein
VAEGREDRMSKRNENALFHIQDNDCPMYVLARDYVTALQRWETLMREQNQIAEADPVPPPYGIARICEASQFLPEPWEPMLDLVEHLRRQSQFSRRTFGPGTRTVGIADHIEKELLEVREAAATAANAELSGALDRSHRDDLLAEWIDVAILAFDGAWRTGASPEEIVAALVAKQAKNEARKWPDWRSADPNKAIEHDRTAEGGVS